MIRWLVWCGLHDGWCYWLLQCASGHGAYCSLSLSSASPQLIISSASRLQGVPLSLLFRIRLFPPPPRDKQGALASQWFLRRVGLWILQALRSVHKREYVFWITSGQAYMSTVMRQDKGTTVQP